MSLPRNPEDLRGLRAALWIRESTPGQFDRYGPETQRRLIRAAIARLGLVDTGIEFSVARSGSTVYLHRTMREAIAAAQAGAYDVLVVAYVDRWQRNLRQTLNVLEDELHPAGVAVWFCDEEILSSCERNWDQLVDLAKAAESWLRRHRRRVKEGLAAKLASKRDPGGRPPFGFRRNEAKLIEPDPDGSSGRSCRFLARPGGSHGPRHRGAAWPAAVHPARGTDLAALRRPIARRRPRQLAAGRRCHDLERRGPDPVRTLPPDPRPTRDASDLPAADARMRRPVGAAWSVTRIATATSMPASRSPRWHRSRSGRHVASTPASLVRAIRGSTSSRSCRSS